MLVIKGHVYLIVHLLFYTWMKILPQCTLRNTWTFLLSFLRALAFLHQSSDILQNYFDRGSAHRQGCFSWIHNIGRHTHKRTPSWIWTHDYSTRAVTDSTHHGTCTLQCLPIVYFAVSFSCHQHCCLKKNTAIILGCVSIPWTRYMFRHIIHPQ
jgi:hypothetical protein